jgi:DNA-binding transcriptional LysR family regulator
MLDLPDLLFQTHSKMASKMTLRQLEVFAKVAQRKSFAQAGEDLKAGQRSISNPISSLERELETKLFERLGNKVRLTDAGEELLIATQEILRRVESIKKRIAEVSALKKEGDDL